MKPKKGVEEEEEAITFDIRSRPRVILFDGKLSVKSESFFFFISIELDTVSPDRLQLTCPTHSS